MGEWQGVRGLFSKFSPSLSPETSAPKSQPACSQKTLPRWKCLPFSLLSVIFSILEVRFPAILGEYQEEEGQETRHRGEQ